jgi:hypothetical protein
MIPSPTLIFITVVVTHFWAPGTKRRKYKKKKYIKNNSNKKRMPECLENGQKLVEEVQKYKD